MVEVGWAGGLDVIGPGRDRRDEQADDGDELNELLHEDLRDRNVDLKN